MTGFFPATTTDAGMPTVLKSAFVVDAEVLADCVRLLEREGALDVLPMLTEGIRS